MNNIRVLSLAIAFMMLVSLVSCRWDNGGSVLSSSDTAVYNEDAIEKYYYPVINESYYNESEDGQLEWRNEYSPEGYLLSARHLGKFYGEGFAETLIEMDVEIYRYDDEGRMIEEYKGYAYPSCDDDEIHYDKVTTTYRYDENGRKAGSEQTEEIFTMRDMTKDFSDENLAFVYENKMYSECVITEDPQTGGWISEETFYYNIGDPKREYSCTGITEYDEDWRIIAKIKNDPFDKTIVSSEHYMYDDKSHPISVTMKEIDNGEESEKMATIGVEYDRDSRVVRRYRDSLGDRFEITFEYDENNRLINRRRSSDDRWSLSESIDYLDDGTAVKYDVYPTNMSGNKETRYSLPDYNGNYQMIMVYANDGDIQRLEKRVTLEYGDSIPSGRKFGTAGDLADNEKLSSLLIDNWFTSDLGIEEKR